MPTSDLSHQELAYEFLSRLSLDQRIALVFAVHDYIDFAGQEHWSNQTSIVVAMNAYPVGRFRRQDEILEEIGVYLSRASSTTAEEMFNYFTCQMR